MCTVAPDANVDAEDLNKRLADAGTALTATPPVTNSGTPDPTGDVGVDNPAKSGIAGGGDKGMGPNPEDTTGGTGGGDTAPATSTPANPAGYTANADGSFNAQSYLDAHPDVLAEYNRLIATADPNSPWFREHGLDGGAAGFAQWHANNGGYSTSSSNTGGGGTSATASTTLNDLTKSFNDTIKTLQDSTAAQIAALNANSTSLTGQIADMQKNFATSQQELIDNMNKTAAAQSQAFSKALKDLTGATGQTAKKPNYGKALQRNKDLNGSGIGSTMLTGPNGVAPGSATLGTTSLLGAA